MKTAQPISEWMRMAAVAGMSLGLLASCSKPPVKPAAAPKPKSASTGGGAPQVSVAYVSVFEELMPPRGRDPFYPNSRRRDPKSAVVAPGEKPPADLDLVLKGVVGSATHRMVVINTATLELNEDSWVHLPGGKRARLRCVEIGENYAVVKVEGELHARRLELQKKEY